jgi:hypothetical protein
LKNPLTNKKESAIIESWKAHKTFQKIKSAKRHGKRLIMFFICLYSLAKTYKKNGTVTNVEIVASAIFSLIAVIFVDIVPAFCIVSIACFLCGTPVNYFFVFVLSLFFDTGYNFKGIHGIAKLNKE